MSFNAREAAHGLSDSLGGADLDWCDGGGRHDAECDQMTAALQRAYDAGLERAEEIARYSVVQSFRAATTPDGIAAAIRRERTTPKEPTP